MSAATKYDDFERVGRFYKTGSPLTWAIGRKLSAWKLDIPADFVFESSIPWWLRWLVSPHRREWLLAACVHDYLLAHGYDAAFAAGEWYRAAKAMDAGNWLLRPALAAIIWWTVR